MKTVYIFSNKSKIVEYSLTPLRYNRQNLKEMGYDVRIVYSLKKMFRETDIAILFSKPTLKALNEKKTVIDEPSPTIDLLKKIRNYTNKLIWFDTSDSTGVTHFELMPYIDLYMKKQILRDKNLYKKHYYGGRIFTDFYHNNFRIVDETEFSQFFPLEDKYFDKLVVSWNIGLGDMINAFKKQKLWRIYFPSLFKINYNYNFTSPQIIRNIDLFIRTSINLERKLIAFHRKELLQRLDEIIQKNSLNGSTHGTWLSSEEFINSMMNSKILPSPHGWGEIGVRDFEAFIYGAALLKPDVSYMETWPNYFIENETYQPFQLDFSDLNESINDFLENKNKRLEIAENGQNIYRDSISENGMNRFCKWFIQQTEL